MIAACRERGVRRRRLREERATPVRGMGVGHLDTFHLPGYAVGPFLVMNGDDAARHIQLTVNSTVVNSAPTMAHQLDSRIVCVSFAPEGEEQQSVTVNACFETVWGRPLQYYQPGLQLLQVCCRCRSSDAARSASSIKLGGEEIEGFDMGSSGSTGLDISGILPDQDNLCENARAPSFKDWADGFCHNGLNSAACGWDGGRRTCIRGT